MTILDTPDQIRAYQLLAVRAMIRLQKRGMRNSSGKNVRAIWAKYYKLDPARATCDEVIAKIEDELNVIKVRIWEANNAVRP